MNGAGAAWLSGLIALAGVVALTPLVIRLAHRQGWLAHPKADRWHEEATALMGGIGIYAAATLGVAVAGGPAWPLWAGATLLFLTGLIDDLRSVSPAAKVIAQVLATVLLLYAGYAFAAEAPFWLSIPLTFLWVIGITNAFNLLDCMDGLAAGTAAIAAGVLAAFSFFTAGGTPVVAALLAVAGAAGGFLVYNFKPARIFMGDCGSLFLGYAVAALAVVVQGQSGGGAEGGVGLAPYLVSLAVLAVPIFDTSLVTVLRLRHGRAITQGGKDHSAHRLVVLGLSEKRAVLTLYALSLVFGLLALAFHFADVQLFYALAAFLIVGLIVLGVHLGSADVYAEAAGGRLAPVAQALSGRGGRIGLEVMADVLLVAGAFTMAHYLRFEGDLPLEREASIINALPGVVGIKLIVFYAMGLYRGLWPHAGTPELVRIALASTLASALVYAALVPFYGPSFLSEATFVNDWMVVTIGLTGARFGLRGLRQFLTAQRRGGGGGRRVALYGTGAAGVLLLRGLRQHAEWDLRPVGFLDDDPTHRGLIAQGLTILGTPADLERLRAQHGVEEVLIAAPYLADARVTEVVAACRRAGLPCRRLDLSLRSFDEGDGALTPPDWERMSGGEGERVEER